MVRQARRSLCLFRRETKQRIWTRDLNMTGSRKETPVGVGQRNPEEGVGEGWRKWAVDTGPVDMREGPSRPVSEGRSRWVGIPSSFVEISLETHASVSLHMHIGNAMLHNSSLAPWVNSSILFVCSLSSHSLNCISCSYEEMCDAPIGTTS